MSLLSYKWWSLIAILLFVTGMTFGFTAPPGVTDLMAEDLVALQQLANLLTTLPQFVVFVIIFFKNVSALLLSFILSPILCLVPILSLTVNGWLLAFVASAVTQEMSLGFVLAALLPHGVFEIPALIMGQAAALSFGTMAILALFQKRKRSLLLPNLKQNFKYVLIALALLLLAAIIETYITPLLLT